jgi:GTPase-associated adaptor domain/Calcineurin-like phosphoesterase
MPLTYVHLSDIHFGQEKGADLIVHNDVKARLIDDAADQIRTHFGGVATGVIVTGDVAYGGKAHEYDGAAKWLDQLTEAVRCPKTAVKLVPGNHDIDRDKISASCKYLLDEIVLGGEPKLDAFLRNEDDRQVLYRRFAGYEPFALGYDCPLDSSGGIASDSREELAPGRSIRFFGLNSALICSLSDKEGRLLLGAAQRVLPTEPGVELVVLCHHPLNWLQDSADARKYVRSRARVFISGHEHNPSLQIENVEDGCDLLTLAAGATVPPRAENGYTYTYNLLTFDWCSEGDRLLVKVMPRAWSEDAKHFRTDDVRLGSHEPTNRLASPNFRRGAPCVAAAVIPPISENQDAAPPSLGTMDEKRPQAPKMEAQVTDAFQLVILKFFRDLTPAQRLTVLVDLNALPPDLNESLSLSMERHVVNSLVRAGRLEELDRSIQQIQSQATNSTGGKE